MYHVQSLPVLSQDHSKNSELRDNMTNSLWWLRKVTSVPDKQQILITLVLLVDIYISYFKFTFPPVASWNTLKSPPRTSQTDQNHYTYSVSHIFLATVPKVNPAGIMGTRHLVTCRPPLVPREGNLKVSCSSTSDSFHLQLWVLSPYSACIIFAPCNKLIINIYKKSTQDKGHHCTFFKIKTLFLILNYLLCTFCTFYLVSCLHCMAILNFFLS